jgi:type IV pilus assembly protein PilB
VSALRAVSHGADATEILGQAPQWEPIVATLISLLLRKGLVADWEFIEEYRKI